MATKKAKVETTTIDFSNSIEKIQTTAKTVNTEVVDTAIEVLEDLRTNGEKIRTVASAKVKEAIENLTIENGVKLVKETATNINKYNLETAEEVIEVAVKGGKEWQEFLAKSLKNGVTFFGEQQDITLTALEGLKKRYSTRNFRLKQLFNFDFNFAGKEIEVKVPTKKATAKAADAVIKKAAKTAKASTKTAKKVTAKAKTTAKKATAKVTKPVAKKTTKVATKKVTAKVAAPKAAKKATVKTDKNNLRVIEGIGPKIEELLNKGGIFTFQQLADASQDTIKGILAAAGSRYKMHDPITWNQQATLAAAGKKEALAKLQDELKGGRAAK